ncbi:MAG TPA: TRAP transporter small permease subunit [Candidatus Limnocylindria bacterium]|nr:TRAP transporter small permease subunit [Candidatus Limnocylindria bacterium]
MGFLRGLSRVVDAVNDRVGRSVRLLTLLLVLVTTTDVVMRYLFRTSFVFVQEAEWHIFAVLFLLAAGYAHLKKDHVRVDIIYARQSDRTKAVTNLIGGLLFLFPTCFLLIYSSIPFVVASVRVLEGSPDPGGLPGRFVLKAVIPVGFLLLALQGVSELIKDFDALRSRRAAR